MYRQPTHSFPTLGAEQQEKATDLGAEANESQFEAKAKKWNCLKTGDLRARTQFFYN